jgi:hypothetical protein
MKRAGTKKTFSSGFDNFGSLMVEVFHTGDFKREGKMQHTLCLNRTLYISMDSLRSIVEWYDSEDDTPSQRVTTSCKYCGRNNEYCDNLTVGMPCACSCHKATIMPETTEDE